MKDRGKDMEHNLISIIIPTYNRVEFIERALNSITMQNYDNYEVIVVDDGSTDDTESYMAKIVKENNKISFHKKPNNSGPSDSRKIGFKKSKGDVVVFFDDDDEYTDLNLFTSVMKMFEKNVIAVLTTSKRNTKNGESIAEHVLGYEGEFTSDEMLDTMQLTKTKPNSTFTAFFDKKNLVNVQLEEMITINDSSIYLRAFLGKGIVRVIDKEFGYYHIHSNNISEKMPMKFIEENISEKNKIFKESNLMKTHPSWFDEHYMVTLEFYIGNSKPSFKDVKYLNDKYKKDFNKSFTAIKMYLYLYKRRLARILGR